MPPSPKPTHSTLRPSSDRNELPVLSSTARKGKGRNLQLSNSGPANRALSTQQRIGGRESSLLNPTNWNGNQHNLRNLGITLPVSKKKKHRAYPAARLKLDQTEDCPAARSPS